MNPAGTSKISQLLAAYRAAVNRQDDSQDNLANRIATCFAHDGRVSYDGSDHTWVCSCGASDVTGRPYEDAWERFRAHRSVMESAAGVVQ